MISLKNVSKWYGPFQVLTDCTTEVKKGEVVVVCGPSGSGKSTLIKTVNGLEPFQKGEITINGQSVGDKKTNLSKLRAKVGNYAGVTVERKEGRLLGTAPPNAVRVAYPRPNTTVSARLTAIVRATSYTPGVSRRLRPRLSCLLIVATESDGVAT